MNSLKDKVGNRYGRLVITKRAKTKNKRVYWYVKCDCGNKKVVAAGCLHSGDTLSCGCYHKEVVAKIGASTKLPNGGGAFNALLSRYINGAKKRNFPFKLSKDEFKTLTAKSCYYCGERPKQLMKRGGSEYLYNGIDRIDNNIEYNTNNCVPCCKICNRMKSIIPISSFLEACKKITEYQESLNV